MKIHNQEILFENKLWRVTALLHVNGTFSGKIINKSNKMSTGWHIHPTNNREKIPSGVPKYLVDIIKDFVMRSSNCDNLLGNAHIAI